MIAISVSDNYHLRELLYFKSPIDQQKHTCTMYHVVTLVLR